MEKKSRVKKYEALRNEIESSYDIEQPNTTSEDVLRTFDETVFKKTAVTDDVDLKHAKKDDVQATLQHSFTNEYLDDFMREVREYNIRKGTRSIDSTEIDILTKISSLPSYNKKNVVTYVEEEPAEKIEIQRSRSEIVKEVEALFQETLHGELSVDEVMDETDCEVEETENEQSVEVEKEQPVIIETIEALVSETNESEMIEDVFKKDLAQSKMNAYEAELNNLSSGVDKNNRLLNITLGFLIVVLLAIIGFIVFAIYQAGGFSL